MRIFYFIAILFLLTSNTIEAQHNLLLRIHNTQHSQAVLYAIKGGNSIAVDTAQKHLGAFAFSNIDQYPCGVYKVFLSDDVYLETILNGEDVSIEADATNLLLSVKVHQSVENQILFAYWKYAYTIRDSMVNLQLRRQIAIKNNNDLPTPETLEIDKKVLRMNKAMESYAYQQALDYPKAFAPVLLVAYQIPSYQTYVEQGNEPYPNENMFYLYHFFDNIDFTNKNLLNTKVLFVSINDFIKAFGEQGTTEIYKDVTDKVLEHTHVNPDIHRYAINLFIETFESSKFQKVFFHIVERHLLNCDCYHEQEKAEYRKKLEIAKSLMIGKTIPEIKMKDLSNKKQSLHRLDGNIKILVFWNSGCERCHELLPVLKNVSVSYAEMGLKIYAVGIEENKDSWTKDIAKFGIENMIHVSDYKGLASPLIPQFNVWSTPLIYMMDKNNKIIAKPSNEAELYQSLIEYQHKVKE